MEGLQVGAEEGNEVGKMDGIAEGFRVLITPLIIGA
jgi:hypothetical protein